MKKNKKKIVKKAEPREEGLLPQNIVTIGTENAGQDKKIYISQSAYKEIHQFTKDKTTTESGGVLVGDVVNEFGKLHIIVHAFIEAKFSEGTPTTLTFTHESWDYIHKQIQKKYPDYKIIGWIHTHPDFGIFLSEYDKFIQNNFFNEETQIAYVVDPIQNIEGFYYWLNGKLEKCDSFCVFDRTGVKITVAQEQTTVGAKEKGGEPDSFVVKLLITLLCAFTVILFMLSLTMNSKIRALQYQIENMQQTFSEYLQYIMVQQSSQENRLSSVESVVFPEEEPEVTEEQTGEDTTESTPEGEAADNENTESAQTSEQTTEQGQPSEQSDEQAVQQSDSTELQDNGDNA